MDQTPNFLTGYHLTNKEKRSRAAFARDKFPNYEPFWESFVAPRTTSYWRHGFVANVPAEERRIVRLSHRIFCGLYHTNEPVDLGGRNARERERSYLRISFNRLQALCNNFDHLLFVLPVVTRGSDDVTKSTLDLGTYRAVAERIRGYDEGLDALPSFNMEYFMPRHSEFLDVKTAAQIKAEDDARMRSDEPGLKKLIGDYPSIQALVSAHTESLTIEVNRLWGGHILPLVTGHAGAPKAPPAAPTRP